MDILIEQSSNEGEIICDPFMGSGSVGVSAISQSRLFYGNDLSIDSLNHTIERLENIEKIPVI